MGTIADGTVSGKRREGDGRRRASTVHEQASITTVAFFYYGRSKHTPYTLLFFSVYRGIFARVESIGCCALPFHQDVVSLGSESDSLLRSPLSAVDQGM